MLTRVTLTLPQRLLTQIDELARSHGLSRSALVRHSLELMVQAQEEEATLARARRLYAEIEAEDRDLTAAYAPLVAETVPTYIVEGEKHDHPPTR
jgi:metal-responsive CopG/Arc/MetJ family transcriptional regulator